MKAKKAIIIGYQIVEWRKVGQGVKIEGLCSAVGQKLNSDIKIRLQP